MSETPKPTPEPMPLRKAMERAFHLGQTYWQQADHEFISWQRKADVTAQKFQELAAKTCSHYDDALAAERAARERAEAERDALLARVRDDALAMTCQSIGQYRKALLAKEGS